MRSAFVLLAALTTANLGCSEVLVEPQGGGGQGAAAGTSSGSGAQQASSSAMTSASSSSGVDPEIEAFCEATGICMPTCTGAFQSFQNPPCEEQGVAFATCVTAIYDAATCSMTGCDAELEALLACRRDNPTDCSGGGGTADETECAFEGECELGTVGVICSFDNEEAECTCFLNSLEVATCTSPVPPDPWDVCLMWNGCCGPLMGAVAPPPV